MNKHICDNFKYTDEYTEYKPHVTLAYLDKGMGQFYIDLINERFPDFKEIIKVNSLVFSDPNSRKIYAKLN